MQNFKTGERELAYTVRINDIKPIEGSDNCECAVVGGWNIMVKKNSFKPNDFAIYFEIDSKLPPIEPFLFLEKKHYKIKSQRYSFGGKGKFISQGLLMSLNDFLNIDDIPLWAIKLEDKLREGKSIDGIFLTEAIGVVYSDENDNKRKSAPEDKYKKMTSRKPQIFKQPWAKWFMRRNWGKKLMFFLFGSKKDNRTPFPNWVKKTDEERIQNIPWILQDKSTSYVITEKIDGTSTTATYRKIKKKKPEFYVCSRNVVFTKKDDKCYYDNNVYIEMAEKYNFEKVLKDIVDKYNLEWATIQGETYGKKIQKREYGLEEHDFMAFNLIFSDRGRLSSLEARLILNNYNIPFVPILNLNYKLPDNMEEILAEADGTSAIDGKMREGIVVRSLDGQKSFKVVSNEYLLKYH